MSREELKTRMARIAVIASYAPSFINFRRELLACFVEGGTRLLRSPRISRPPRARRSWPCCPACVGAANSIAMSTRNVTRGTEDQDGADRRDRQLRPLLHQFSQGAASVLRGGGHEVVALAPDFEASSRAALMAMVVRCETVGLFRTGHNPLRDSVIFAGLTRGRPWP